MGSFVRRLVQIAYFFNKCWDVRGEFSADSKSYPGISLLGFLF